MQAIRSNPATASLAYDDGMQDIAKANLDAELKGSFRGYKGYHNVKIDREKSTLTLIAQYDYKDTTLEKLIGYITKNNEASNLNFNLSSKWTKIGVAAKTHKGQTYIAITLQVKNT